MLEVWTTDAWKSFREYNHAMGPGAADWLARHWSCSLAPMPMVLEAQVFGILNQVRKLIRVMIICMFSSCKNLYNFFLYEQSRAISGVVGAYFRHNDIRWRSTHVRGAQNLQMSRSRQYHKKNWSIIVPRARSPESIDHFFHVVSGVISVYIEWPRIWNV